MDPEDRDEPRDRDELGRFAPGHRQLAPPRTGKPNKITQSIRERVLNGFNDDPRGDGVSEFVKELKRDHPPAASVLLGKMMPSSQFEDEFSGTTINAEPVHETTSFEILPVASANFLLAAGTTIVAPNGVTIVASGTDVLVDAETADRLGGLSARDDGPRMIGQQDAADEPVEQRAACPDNNPPPSRPSEDDDNKVVPIPRWRTTLPPLNEPKPRWPRPPGAEFD